MKFKHTKPAIFEECQKRFGVSWDEVVITYGDTVYSKYPISDDLKVHEAVHIDQQLAMGVEEWWGKYFEDSAFRLSQEIPAYKAQLEYIKEHYARPERRRLEKHIYKSMATVYGDMCTKEEAKNFLI